MYVILKDDSFIQGNMIFFQLIMGTVYYTGIKMLCYGEKVNLISILYITALRCQFFSSHMLLCCEIFY